MFTQLHSASVILYQSISEVPALCWSTHLCSNICQI